MRTFDLNGIDFDNISISDAIKLLNDIKSNVENIKRNKEKLNNFKTMAMAAYGLIDNPYKRIVDNFYSFLWAFNHEKIEQIQESLLNVVSFNEKNKKRTKCVNFLFTNLGRNGISFFDYIEKFNRDVELYNLACEESRQLEIFKLACRIDENNTNVIFNNRNKVSFLEFKELRNSDKKDPEFIFKEYGLRDWAFYTSTQHLRFSRIKNDESFKNFLSLYPELYF